MTRDKLICGKHRDISLLAVAGKISARVMLCHLLTHVVENLFFQSCSVDSDPGTVQTTWIMSLRYYKRSNVSHNLYTDNCGSYYN